MNHSPIPGKIRYCFGLSKIFLFFIRSLEFATMAFSKISTVKSVFQKRVVSPTVSFHRDVWTDDQVEIRAVDASDERRTTNVRNLTENFYFVPLQKALRSLDSS